MTDQPQILHLPQGKTVPKTTLIIKRTFDITASAAGMLLLAPVFFWIASIIRRDSPGPVFYRGARMGRGGKPFSILKFRTMREEPASYLGPRVTASGDERITPIGKWLRDTKLNELPQLWNVLTGEMSLVGPRPEDPAIVAERWSESDRQEILSVAPGVTSPASISYRDEEHLLNGDDLMSSYMDNIAPDKLRLDRLYVRHRTFLSDLDVIFWTLIVLIPLIYKAPDSEGLLFGGPFTRFVRPYLNWTIIDFSITMLTSLGLGAIWRLFGPMNVGWEVALIASLGYSVFFGVANTLLGLKRVEWSRASTEDMLGLIVSCTLVTTGSILLDLRVPNVNLPDGFLITAGLLSAVGFVIARYRLRLLTGFASRWVNSRGFNNGERVLVVGAGAGGEIAAWLLRRSDMRQMFNVVGYVDDSPLIQGMRFDGIPVLGTTADIPALVKKEDIGLICFAISKITPQDQEHILRNCRQTKARLVILSDVMRTLEKHFFQEENQKP